MKKYISFALSALFVQAIANECHPIVSGGSGESSIDDSKIKSEIAYGVTCVIPRHDTVEAEGFSIKNEGTLVFEDYSKLIFKKLPKDNPSIFGEAHTGNIKINGYDTKIEALNADLQIANQNITFTNGKKLTITAGSLVLGQEGKKASFSAQNSADLALEVKRLSSVDASFKNLEITSNELKSMEVGQLSLDNIELFTNQDLSIISIMGDNQKDLGSYTLVGKNTIDSKYALTLQGKHSFEGGGSLIFGGETVKVGEQSQSTIFTGKNSQEGEKKTKVGFHQTKEREGGVIFNKVEAQDLTLQIVRDGDGAILSNIDLTLKDAILEGRKSDGESQILVIENGATDQSTQGAIKILADTPSTSPNSTTETQKSKTTFQGMGIKIYGQKIEIGQDSAPLSQKTSNIAYTLSLKTDENAGEITLGKPNTSTQNSQQTPPQPTTLKDGEVLIEGKNGANGSKQTLELLANQLNYDGNVTLKNLSIQTQSQSGVMLFVGKSDAGILTLENANITAGMLDEKGVGKYQAIAFTAEDESKKSTLKLSSDIEMKASHFAFKNQNVNLESKTLSLYSYGAINLPTDSKTSTPEKVGEFAFYNTLFDGSVAQNPLAGAMQTASTLKLYSGEDGAKIHSNGLVLKDANLESLKINGVQKNSTKASLDLSDNSSNLTALGSVTILASDFKYKIKDGVKTQGVGMDLFVGDQNEVGNLVLKSDGASVQGKDGTQSEKFIIGGTLTLDNSSATTTNKGIDGRSTFDVEMGEKKLSNFGIDLAFENGGGLSVLHINEADQSTEFKAKSFEFDAGSRVHSKNGKLTLSSETGAIEIKGTTILEGTDTAKASIEAKVKTGGGTGVNASMLTLHDVEVRGSAELKNSFEFKDSNILAQGDGKNRTFMIEKTTGEVSGVSTLALKNAIIDVKNTSNGAELKLNSGGSITSSGDSELKTGGISVDSANSGGEGVQNTDSNTFTLNVLDGTLKLTEMTTKNSIGAITLGYKNDKNQTIGGNLVLLKSSGAKQEQYNALYIKAPLTSYGNSSITAESFSIQAETNPNNDPIISSTGGELKLIAKKNTDNVFKITSGEIKLEDGDLGYYVPKTSTRSSDLELGAITLGVADPAQPIQNQGIGTKITSSGSSAILASKNGLEIHGAEISSTNGTLRLVGLKDSSTFGNITLNNGGLSVLESNDPKSESMSIKLMQGKSITMISNSPFVKPNNPLGGGGFGQIIAKSVEFMGDSTADMKLINLVVKPEQLASGADLFSLKEGDQTLIKTTEGIKKTSQSGSALGVRTEAKITLKDISLNSGGYKSLKLTPKLEENADKTQVLSLLLEVKVEQNTIAELVEGLEPEKRKEMQEILSQGRYEEIADSILSSNNPFKIGIAENIAQGNTKVVSEALFYSSDAMDAVADLVQTNYKLYDQVSSLAFASLTNRMARANNPYASKEELASLLQSASKYSYASSDDGIILDVVEKTPPDKGGLWASYDGAMRSGKGVSSSVNGLSAGYDGMIGESILLGGFVSYLYGAYNGEHLYNSSHNLHFGLYARMLFGNNELDLVASQMVAFNSATLNVGYGSIASYLGGEFGFNMYASNIQARYGYAFALGEEESPYYLKPLVGLDLTILFNDDASVKSANPIQVNKRENLRFDVMAGLELRKYFNAQSYFFVLPMVQAGIVNLGNEAQVGFVGSRALSHQFDEQRDINVGVYAGGQGSVAENLAISGSLGIKMGVKNTDVMTSWNLGLRYKF